MATRIINDHSHLERLIGMATVRLACLLDRPSTTYNNLTLLIKLVDVEIAVFYVGLL